MSACSDTPLQAELFAYVVGSTAALVSVGMLIQLALAAWSAVTIERRIKEGASP